MDQFLDKWIKSKNKHFPNGFLEAFKSDFGIHTDVCNVQKSCQSLQKCSNQGDPDGPDAIAVFLAYEAMVHLANYFNMLYSSIFTASNFASNRVATLVQDFFPSPESKFDSDPHVSPVHEASMALGLASFFMFFIPTAGIALVSIPSIIKSMVLLNFSIKGKCCWNNLWNPRRSRGTQATSTTATRSYPYAFLRCNQAAR